MQVICINCPKGCEMTVECPRGKEYGIAEMTNPTRMVTGLVRVAGTRRPLPVKTRTAIPKGKIAEVTNLLANTTVLPPKKIGDLVIENACGTGVDVVATAMCAV